MQKSDSDINIGGKKELAKIKSPVPLNQAEMKIKRQIFATCHS